MKYIKLSSENNPKWKEDEVGNKGLHSWVRRHINRSKICEICKDTKKKVQLANKTGNYNREFENWFYLCAKCHINYDKAWLKRKDNYFKKGYKKTTEHLAKLSKSLKGRKVWNKGAKGLQGANKTSFRKGEDHSNFMKELWEKRKRKEE